MIHVENLSFSYNRNSKLFDSLDLDLGQGNIYGLLGKNGTGKTTLIKLMTGMLLPKTGSSHILGASASDRTPSILSEFFILPEEFLLPSIKMKDYVNINSPFYPNFSYSDFEGYMKDFELENNKKLQNLSFGQKKKFLLAFALATNVKLLLLDEPTNGLDIPSKSQFRKTVARSLTEEKSIIISTHQVRDLETLIDSIIILEDGKIIFNSTCSEVTLRLSFGKTLNADNDDKILYKEEGIGGYKTVKASDGHDESVLDLELFFNAIVTDKGQIKAYFNN